MSHPSSVAPLRLRWPLLALVAIVLLWQLPALNRAIFLAVNEAASIGPAPLWRFLSVVGEWPVVGVILAISIARRPGRWPALLVGVLAAFAVSSALKWGVAELRPPAVLAPGSFHLLAPMPHTPSFPSGHSTAAAALATLLAWGRSGAGRWWPALLALAIMLSRVAIGVHWPIDLVAGGLVGWGCARAATMLVGERPAGRWAWMGWVACAACLASVAVGVFAQGLAGDALSRSLLMGAGAVVLAVTGLKGVRRA